MILLLFLFIFWFALVGKFSIDTIIVGVILVPLIYAFTRKYIYNKQGTYATYAVGFKPFIIIRYLITLIIEVVKANIDMIKIVLFEDSQDEHPSIAKFNANLRSDAAKTMLAHAITLTPGTITIGMMKDVFYVTGMNPEMLDGIDESVFIEILHDLEE